MKESRAKPLKARVLLTMLVVVGLTAAATAQDLSIPPERKASFLPDSGKEIEPAFSGLAATPPEVVPPLIAAPVAAAPLPDVSPEAVGAPSGEGLGADMWQGTPYTTATILLSAIAPTKSPTLNTLARRLLTTAAAPPEGDAKNQPSLTNLRVAKLVSFAAPEAAWALAQQAEPQLIDDATFHAAAEAALTTDGEKLCGAMPDFVKKRPALDWQPSQIICQLRAKDTKAAQVGLDVLRTQDNRDVLFLAIADKTILGDSKALPHGLTTLTPAIVALLRLAPLSLPASLYTHPDAALVPALLRLTPQLDVAQLAVAERAVERGMLDSASLEGVYRSVAFSPNALADPLNATESGLRLHALLFQSAMNEKDPQKRSAYAVAFAQSATPALMNGVGAVVVDMLGDAKPVAENAVALTQIFLTAGRGDAALEALRLAKQSPANAEALRALYPQLALTGLESAADLTRDFDLWFTAASDPTNPKTDLHDLGATMLLLDAAGLPVPDTAWNTLLAAARANKHVTLSPLLLERLQNAGTAKKRAETILLALTCATDADISLPAALAITRALRQAGLKSEAALFARERIAVGQGS